MHFVTYELKLLYKLPAKGYEIKAKQELLFTGAESSVESQVFSYGARALVPTRRLLNLR